MLVGTGVWGLVVGSVVAVGFVIGVVLVKGRDGGRDPEGWAWIDVVSGTNLICCYLRVLNSWLNQP